MNARQPNHAGSVDRHAALEKLRRQIQVGRDELDRGDFVEYDEESLRELFDEIQTRGRARYEASS